MVSITDSPDKAARWKAQYSIADRNVYTYDTMERMADNPDIDVVYIVTPNALHLQHTLAAAKAGKHVYCEKPMEISLERREQMMARVQGGGSHAGRRIPAAVQSPTTSECVRLAREKVLGTVNIVEAVSAISVGDPSQWRLKRALAGGGALMDVGVYACRPCAT